MAGQRIERPRVSPETIRHLGSVYLPQLLKKMPTGRERAYSFDPIANHIAKDKIKLPNFLINSLGLDKLAWISSALFPQTADSLSLLLIGTQEETFSFHSYASADFTKAAATVEITHTTIIKDGKPETVPLIVRVAGVTGDDSRGKRIVAATYDVTEDGRLTKLNVSISSKETFAGAHIGKVSGLVAIPTNKDHPYRTAGLITQAMQGNLGIERDLLQHGSAVVFELDERQKTINEQGCWGLNYTRKIENGLITVGLPEDEAKKHGLAPWKVSLPEFLPKA